MKREDILLLVFGIILLFSVIMLSLHYSKLTGFAVVSTVSNVTIANYVSISASTNLAQGILFGSITSLPAVNVNASHNYDGTSSASTMYINVSTDSNQNIDFCILADAALTSGANVIGLANETYSNSTTSVDATAPAIANNVSLTTGYVKSGVNIAKGTANFYRFWLSVPVSQAAATYNNSISFEGITTGGACS